MAQSGLLKNCASISPSTVNSTLGLSREVSRALQSQPKIQQSLQDIQHILNGLEEPRPEVQSKIESLRED